MGHRARFVGLAATLAIAAALTVAACGGASVSAGTTTASPDSSPIAFARCMRSHGVSNFPDPSGGGPRTMFEETPSGGSGTLIYDGHTFSGPKVVAAEKACAKYLMSGGPPPPPTAAPKRRLLAMARCMCTHGGVTFRPDGSGG